ncbi:MAG TPA: hypothetical protein DD473_03105 [Planctomycetaceae bacterium]|nr:hypothetical protein [Planctomycetaceae bacterium]|tara:strand:+ start:1455 stop:1994 length:540 start_codon:yes stop_codon:yes gene_type:complete
MLDPILQQTTIPILEQAAIFGQKRHQVLAGNIANIDTPDYRTRDLSVDKFEESLKQAIQARRHNAHPQPMLPNVLGQSPDSPSLSQLHWQQASLGNPSVLNSTGQMGQIQPKLEDYFPKSLSVADSVNNRNLTFHDGANRSIEMESMEMVKNASLQGFAIEVMRSQMSMLETVISERVV